MKRGRAPASVALPTLRDAAAASSVGPAAEAAHLALAASGSAVDAVIAGFFAAAGADASVLLGSAAALAATAGSSARAFDGRPLQPGKGAPRPRGFVEGQAVPDAARVPVPRTVPMLMLMHAYGGRASLSSLAKHGADVAAGLDAKQRAKVLRRVGAAGVIGLRTEGVHDALLAAGNSVAGGSLTEADLDAVLPADADARALLQREGDAMVGGWPWAGEGTAEDEAGWVVDVVAAADARGGVAVLSFAHQPKGVGLPAVELSAPRLAVPVRRGVTRVAPGAVLRGPGPIAVARFGRDLAVAFGLCGAWEAGQPARLQDALDAEPLASLREGGAVETALGDLAHAHGASRCVAAVRAPKATRGAVLVPGATGSAS
jgi:gamma-glutamyltranspeptidase/glutathione hydrolase